MKKSIVLDPYEQQIEKDLKKEKYISASNLDKTKKMFQEAVKLYRQTHKKK